MNAATDLSPADGVIGRDSEGRLFVTFTRHYPHTREHVWAAITDPAQTRNWIGRFDFEPKPGGELSMVLDGSDPENGTVTTGEIVECTPPEVLEYWMFSQDMDQVLSQKHINRWELTAVDGGCELHFTNTFAPGERARNSILCGWHLMIEQVSDTVDGKTTDWEIYTRDRLVELYWHYRNKPLPNV